MTLNARASWPGYFALCGAWFLLASIGTVANLRQSSPDWHLVSVSAAIGSGFALWLWSFRVHIQEDALRYQTLLSRTRSIRLKEIGSARIETNFGKLLSAPQQLVIYPIDESATKPIQINIKVFARSDIRALFDWLGPKLKGQRRVGIFKKVEI